MIAIAGERPAPAPGAGETARAFFVALPSEEDIARFLAPAVSLTAMATGEVTRGREVVVTLLSHLHRQAFATAPAVRSVVATGDLALVEIEFVGVHVGAFAGIAPTGAQVRVPSVVAVKLGDGGIVELRDYLPLDALVRQIRDGEAAGEPARQS